MRLKICKHNNIKVHAAAAAARANESISMPTFSDAVIFTILTDGDHHAHGSGSPDMKGSLSVLNAVQIA